MTGATSPTSDHPPQTNGDHLSVSSSTTSPVDDSPLLALEKQFNATLSELLALERLAHNQKRYRSPAARLPVQSTIDSYVGCFSFDENATQQLESVLARLYPIECAIMQTPARTIAGLGVKARHAAYVMSQYWEASIDGIDWDAQAIRLLIEAVCNFARTPLPCRNVGGDE
jgi:hypothetical protein